MSVVERTVIVIWARLASHRLSCVAPIKDFGTSGPRDSSSPAPPPPAIVSLNW